MFIVIILDVLRGFININFCTQNRAHHTTRTPIPKDGENAFVICVYDNDNDDNSADVGDARCLYTALSARMLGARARARFF